MFTKDGPDNQSHTAACDKSKHSRVANRMIHLRLPESPVLIYNGDLGWNQEFAGDVNSRRTKRDQFIIMAFNGIEEVIKKVTLELDAR